MADTKCNNCGKAVELMSDANGGYRWYHAGNGGVPALECAVEGTAGLVAAPKELTDKEIEAAEERDAKAKAKADAADKKAAAAAKEDK
jgi:hypothetical protein